MKKLLVMIALSLAALNATIESDLKGCAECKTGECYKVATGFAEKHSTKERKNYQDMYFLCSVVCGNKAKLKEYMDYFKGGK